MPALSAEVAQRAEMLDSLGLGYMTERERICLPTIQVTVERPHRAMQSTFRKDAVLVACVSLLEARLSTHPPF